MSKDLWFYSIALAVSKQSKCLSRQIGAILVRDDSIIAQGYNGPARGIPHCNTRHIIDPHLYNTNMVFSGVGCPRRDLGFNSGEGLHLCIAAHAERNCIANAARNGVCTLNTTMYLTCEVPCKDCLSEIINAGITELVVTSKDGYDSMGEFILSHSDLVVRVYGDKL